MHPISKQSTIHKEVYSETSGKLSSVNKQKISLLPKRSKALKEQVNDLKQKIKQFRKQINEKEPPREETKNLSFYHIKTKSDLKISKN